jgi:hypothetical protein
MLTLRVLLAPINSRTFVALLNSNPPYLRLQMKNYGTVLLLITNYVRSTSLVPYCSDSVVDTGHVRRHRAMGVEVNRWLAKRGSTVGKAGS